MTLEHLLRREDIPEDALEVLREEIAERREAEAALTRALHESQQREAEVEGLLSGTRWVLEGITFEETARHLFETCKRLTGSAAGYVALLSEDGTENDVLFLDAGGFPCAVDESLPMPIRGLREEAYRSKAVAYDNNFLESRWQAYIPAGHCPLESVMFAPLVVDGEAAGVLGLANKPGGFSERDVRIASVLGELTAIALRDARILDALTRSEAAAQRMAEAARAEAERMANDLRLASAVQQSTLPKRCFAEGLEIERRFQPSEVVGGDFFGIVRSPSGRSVIYTGDVSGHGLPSSLVVSLLVGIIHEVVDPDAMACAQALAALQERLYGRLQATGHYATLCLCRFSPKSGALRYANAGSPWPILVRGGEAKQLRGEAGTPLGLWEYSDYVDQEVVLEPEETLFLISDGILEARRRSGGRVTAGMVASWCEAAADQPLPHSLDCLMGSFGTDIGDRTVEDDLLALAVRRIPTQVFTLPDAHGLPESLVTSMQQDAATAGRTEEETEDALLAIRAAVRLVGEATFADDYIRLAYGFSDTTFQAVVTPWMVPAPGSSAPLSLRLTTAAPGEAEPLSELRRLVDFAEWDAPARYIHVTKRWPD